MSCESGGTSEEPKKPSLPQWAINRNAADMLGIDWDAPRPDQKGYESGWHAERQAPSFERMMATRGIIMIRRDGKCYDPQPDGTYKAEDGEVLPDVRTAALESLPEPKPQLEK